MNKPIMTDKDCNIKQIKYDVREDNVYMFKAINILSDRQRREIRDMFKEALPKNATLILLDEGMDYIPLTDNEALMKRMDDIEASLQELIGLVDSRTR